MSLAAVLFMQERQPCSLPAPCILSRAQRPRLDTHPPTPPFLTLPWNPCTQQEAVWLGRYPTAESAARAHDIAAIKLHGPAAATNYEPETYSRVLPTLSSHSEDQVVGALRKDSALAVQRTSRFRGVRRVGARAFDARLEEALGGDGSGLNTSPSSHTSMFVPDQSSS